MRALKLLIPDIRPLDLILLVLAGGVASTLAQEVSIPDPALNAAIRATLQKSNGFLTQADLVGLTGLSAIFRNITNVQGLAAAQNLVSLDLQDNRTDKADFASRRFQSAVGSRHARRHDEPD